MFFFVSVQDGTTMNQGWGKPCLLALYPSYGGVELKEILETLIMARKDYTFIGSTHPITLLENFIHLQ